jgi:hypothetical protein
MAAATAAAWRRRRQPGGSGGSVAAAAWRAARRQHCVGSRIASAQVDGGGSMVTLWGGGLPVANAVIFLTSLQTDTQIHKSQLRRFFLFVAVCLCIRFVGNCVFWLSDHECADTHYKMTNFLFVYL